MCENNYIRNLGNEVYEENWLGIDVIVVEVGGLKVYEGKLVRN